MIRTVEILFVIIILAGAFIAVSYFTVLPPAKEVSPINLRRLSFTTLQMLDSDYDLSRAAFETGDPTEDNATWNGLQVALAASLPANIVYNLTVYDIDASGQVYSYVKSFSNTEGITATSDVSTYTIASSNVTFNFKPQKIGESSGGTLYILNCSDANGWWITGYTAQGLAQDLYNMLSPYYVNTVMVQNTSQLYNLLNGQSLQGETVQNAVIINTCGEAVPIPTTYVTQFSSNLAQYPHLLGQRVRTYNWTWASIVGYPFYYISNTASLSGEENKFGIYGMEQISQVGARNFLRGLNNQAFSASDNTAITVSGDRQVTFTQRVADSCNYYGIYPSASQTASRALSNTTLASYNMRVGLNIFNPIGDALAGAIYNHYATSSTDITGSFFALGLTRTPDIRVASLGLLSYYSPRVYASEYSAEGTSRLVVLQLGMAGGS